MFRRGAGRASGRAHQHRGLGLEKTDVHDGSLTSGLTSESPARSRPVHRAKEPFIRAIRRLARWDRRNRPRSGSEQQTPLSLKPRGRYRDYGLSGSAPRQWTPPSSPLGSTTSPRGSGWLKHVTVAAFILLSGDAVAYHDHDWCFGGSKFVDLTDCVVWEERNEFTYRARNTCNEYVNLTVCWTGVRPTHGQFVPGSNYKCDKSDPIPPAVWGGMNPGEDVFLAKGEFVWWAWNCEE